MRTTPFLLYEALGLFVSSTGRLVDAGRIVLERPGDVCQLVFFMRILGTVKPHRRTMQTKNDMKKMFQMKPLLA